MVLLFIHKTKVFIFVFFVSIEMREKLPSQREAVISLPKSWDLTYVQFCNTDTYTHDRTVFNI